jgi:hypothetical protein
VGPAAAQEYSARIYRWLPGESASAETDFGTVDADSGGGFDLSDIDMAFMGTFEARKGPWGFVGDFIYTGLSPNESAPFDIEFLDVEIDFQLSALSGYVAYRVCESPKITLDIAGGLRAYGLDVDTTLFGIERPEVSTNHNETWVDPLIGAHVTEDVSTRQALGIAG